MYQSTKFKIFAIFLKRMHKPMSDLIPFIWTEERQQIKAEIEGLPVSVSLMELQGLEKL